MTTRQQRTITPEICPAPDILAGVREDSSGILFEVCFPENDEVFLLIYDKGSREVKEEYPMPPLPYGGARRTLFLKGAKGKDIEYNYRVNGKVVTDPLAPVVVGREKFGCTDERDEHQIRGAFLKPGFKWGDDEAAPCIPWKDVIAYRLHVRGFTMQKESKVRNRGTYRGIIEKIPYLTELGVNCLVLMPACEFEDAVPLGGPAAYKENAARRLQSPAAALPADVQEQIGGKPDTSKLPERITGTADVPGAQTMPPVPLRKVNYWGFSKSWYCAPKRSFAASQYPDVEFKEMVRACHKAGIEVIMTFAFPDTFAPEQMIRVLSWWAYEYHVDGFHLLTGRDLAKAAASSPYLASVKLIYDWFDPGSPDVFGRGNRFADANNGFMTDCRRMLKGDEDMLAAFTGRIKASSSSKGIMNYITGHDGFTLMDLVSYDKKHNEENGEENRDGPAVDYSWNCGMEGPSRKKQIQALRLQQMKNAMAMLLLSAGTPVILAGDELGNSQNGNNNPWCIDSEVTWVDWKHSGRWNELGAFIRELIAFRKAHPIIHPGRELDGNDQISCGYPRFSLHASKAWYADFSYQSREIGMMYCGGERKSEDIVYIGYNFHWESKELAIPPLPDGKCWKECICSGEEVSEKRVLPSDQKTISLPGRCIMVLESTGGAMKVKGRTAKKT